MSTAGSLRRASIVIPQRSSQRLQALTTSMKWVGDDLFEKLSQIGSGGFGSVWKVRHRAMGFVVAAKIVSIKSSDRKTVNDEIEVYKQLVHPNIIAYLGSYWRHDKVWMLMELCHAGSLKDLIRVLDKPLSEDVVAEIVRGVLAGLEALHSKGIIHLDIKVRRTRRG